MKDETALEITEGSVENRIIGKIEKKSGKRIGFNYIILKSFKKSKKNDVVKCLYIKGLLNFGICVIKEGTYGDTKDNYGRDIKDRLNWQKQLHLELQDKIRLPSFLDSFEENGNFYLVIELIKGKSLYKELKNYNREVRNVIHEEEKQIIDLLNYLVQITDILGKLHTNNYVHRDITPGNFIITKRKTVYIIDMELTYSLLNSQVPPFQLGTYGYMSPEQAVAAPPTIQDDIFSLGALILEILSGIHPIKLTDELETLHLKISFLVNDKKISDLIIACFDLNPLKRPTISTIRSILKEYIHDLKTGENRYPTRKIIPFRKEQILETIQNAIFTLASPLLADPNKGWFSENVNVERLQDKHKIVKAWYASFYSGASGIIYLLSKAKQSALDIDIVRPYISIGLQTVKNRYIIEEENINTGLLFGGAGISVTISSAISNGLINADLAYIEWLNTLLTRKSYTLDYMHGITGHGLAIIRCGSFLDQHLFEERLNVTIDILIKKQLADGSWNMASTERRIRRISGFANGISGIIWLLLEYGYIYQNSPAFAAAERGLNWLIKKAIHDKNGIRWKSDSGKELLYGWSEGVAGIALTMLKAYTVTQNTLYKDTAIAILRRIDKKIVDNNLSHGYGLSGLGEVYLEAYKVLQEEEWIERANWIAQIIMHLRKKHPIYGTYWLVQNERIPTADFFEGNSGVIHFLLRFCNTNEIGFPLLSIFKDEIPCITDFIHEKDRSTIH